LAIFDAKHETCTLLTADVRHGLTDGRTCYTFSCIHAHAFITLRNDHAQDSAGRHEQVQGLWWVTLTQHYCNGHQMLRFMVLLVRAGVSDLRIATRGQQVHCDAALT
jgi:hypothetical protein